MKTGKKGVVKGEKDFKGNKEVTGASRKGKAGRGKGNNRCVPSITVSHSTTDKILPPHHRKTLKGKYCSRQKFYNKLVLLITLHKLKIFPRCNMQIFGLENTLSNGIKVHTICAEI